MTFRRPDIYRPPSEHDSYYLPLTSGCSNNTCRFCAYPKLGVRDVEEVKQEIDAMYFYVNNHVLIPGQPDIMYMILNGWDGRKLFLQDGDALVYPYPKMVEVLEYLKKKFPHIQRVASYATPKDILRRSVDELKSLKKLNLGILYMGIESGDDEVLKNMCKGATHADMVEAARKVKEAGMLLSVTVLLGLGSVEGSERHAKETARILTETDPDFVGALTLTLVPVIPLYDACQSGEFELITPFQSIQELKTIVENTTCTNCFFSSMHASNYFALRGTLPGDKGKMITQLERLLASNNPELLRPEYLRGL